MERIALPGSTQPLERNCVSEEPLRSFEAGLSLLLPRPTPKFLLHLHCDCCQDSTYSGTFSSGINSGQVTSWHLRSLEAAFLQRNISSDGLAWTGLKSDFIFSSHSLQWTLRHVWRCIARWITHHSATSGSMAPSQEGQPPALIQGGVSICWRRRLLHPNLMAPLGWGKDLWGDILCLCPNHKIILSLPKALSCWNSERGYFEVTPVKALETVMGAWAGSWGHMLHADSSSLLFICRIWTNFSAVIYTTHHLGTSQKCPAGGGTGQQQRSDSWQGQLSCRLDFQSVLAS